MADTIIEEIMQIVELCGGSGSPTTAIDALELLREQVAELVAEVRAQGEK